jgi:hypothetical protein
LWRVQRKRGNVLVEKFISTERMTVSIEYKGEKER